MRSWASLALVCDVKLRSLVYYRVWEDRLSWSCPGAASQTATDQLNICISHWLWKCTAGYWSMCSSKARGIVCSRLISLSGEQLLLCLYQKHILDARFKGQSSGWKIQVGNFPWELTEIKWKSRGYLVCAMLCACKGACRSIMWPFNSSLVCVWSQEVGRHNSGEKICKNSITLEPRHISHYLELQTKGSNDFGCFCHFNGPINLENNNTLPQHPP